MVQVLDGGLAIGECVPGFTRSCMLVYWASQHSVHGVEHESSARAAALTRAFPNSRWTMSTKERLCLDCDQQYRIKEYSSSSLFLLSKILTLTTPSV